MTAAQIPMLRNRVYYRLKPFLPRSLRIGIRRWFAARKLHRFQHTWPISPGSEQTPEGWPGWPGGQQFALVLTHDVEGREGLARVRELAEFEMRLGFRSSFNFVPEGDYRVPAELRDWLTANGFEVGVHDWNHDGRLFHRRGEFNRRAEKINTYIRDWKVQGFRSAFMLRNLDWLHALEMTYDLSTFDTDPFEPQPHGQHTIFPFWVDPPSTGSATTESRTSGSGHKRELGARAGYVELPYTLPQDSTLFLLLGEKGPTIWNSKLDWIARHGGMALVNVHPDYLQHRTGSNGGSVSVFDHYGEFLRHAERSHRGTCWRALPREVARFVRQWKRVD